MLKTNIRKQSIPVIIEYAKKPSFNSPLGTSVNKTEDSAIIPEIKNTIFTLTYMVFHLLDKFLVFIITIMSQVNVIRNIISFINNNHFPNETHVTDVVILTLIMNTLINIPSIKLKNSIN